MNTLSFCIFNDLKPSYGPVHVQFDMKDFETIKNKVKEITQELTYEKDPSCYYHKKIREDEELNEVTNDLLDRNYSVWNRYEKYYVIAFALNYTRFEIFSKDCDKQLIQWREKDENDEVTGLITDDNYNENPVITVLKMFN
jgi:hypothetical protein